MRAMLTILCSVSALISAPVAQGQAIHMRIVNPAYGEGASLDVGNIPGNPMTLAMLLPTAVPLGQYWTMTPAGNNQFKLSNIFNGPGRCLDVAGDGGLYMDQCGAQIGQRWSVQNAGPHGVRITNAFKPRECLDTLRAGQFVLPVMRPCNGSATQVWRISVTRR